MKDPAVQRAGKPNAIGSQPAISAIMRRKSLKVFDDPVHRQILKPAGVLENGSAGLVSTADDFNAFAQMMLNGGRVGSGNAFCRGHRSKLMTTDQITSEQKLGSELFFSAIVRGWGHGPLGVHHARRYLYHAGPFRLGRRLMAPRGTPTRASSSPAFLLTPAK